jgi:hypothetical protein
MSYTNDKTFQLKCDKCGEVKEVKTYGYLVEGEKLCDKCGTPINEQNIQEVGKDLLLE